jgi:hypothetical protein
MAYRASATSGDAWRVIREITARGRWRQRLALALESAC